MRVLGVDYGQQRIGLALSDPLGITAQGLENLPRRSIDQAVEAVASLAARNEVSEIVVGLPIHMNGSRGKEAEEVEIFCQRLRLACPAAVATLDERLTSRQAERLMIEEGLSRQKRRGMSDQLAAIMILQNYLEIKRLKKA